MILGAVTPEGEIDALGAASPRIGRRASRDVFHQPVARESDDASVR